MMRYKYLITVSFLFASMGSPLGVTTEVQLLPGESYRIVRSVDLMAVHESMSDRREGKKPKLAYLHPQRYAMTRWVAYQCEVPAGTVMAIVRPAPRVKGFGHPYLAYYVKLQPNPPGQQEVIVGLSRGFGDESGRLNPEFFQHVSGPIGKTPEKLTGCIGKKGVPITIP
jgi:hypothetical protein